VGGGGIGRCGGGGLGGVVEEGRGGMRWWMDGLGCAFCGVVVYCVLNLFFESVKYRVVIVEHGRGGNLGRGIDRVFFESWRVRFLDIVVKVLLCSFAGIMVSEARANSCTREWFSCNHASMIGRSSLGDARCFMDRVYLVLVVEDSDGLALE